MAGQDDPSDDGVPLDGVAARGRGGAGQAKGDFLTDPLTLRWAAFLVGNVRDITPWLPQLMDIIGL